MHCLTKKAFTSICPHNTVQNTGKYCTFTDGGQRGPEGHGVLPMLDSRLGRNQAYKPSCLTLAWGFFIIWLCPLEALKGALSLKKAKPENAHIGQGQHLLVWRLRGTTGLFTKGSNLFWKEAGYKGAESDLRTGIPPALFYLLLGKKGWVAVMTPTEGSMARLLRMGSLGHKGWRLTLTTDLVPDLWTKLFNSLPYTSHPVTWGQ